MKIKSVEKKLNEIFVDLIDYSSIPSIIRKLNAGLNESGVFFKSKRYEGEYLKKDFIIIHGYYSPKIMYFREFVDIIIHFPKGMKKIQFDKKSISIFKQKLLRTLYHESRHKFQAKFKNPFLNKAYRSKDERLQYLGSGDEIDAHAYETVVDFKMGLKLEQLQMASKIRMRESEAIWMYKKAFKKKDPRVWNKFLKKVYLNNKKY